LHTNQKVEVHVKKMEKVCSRCPAFLLCVNTEVYLKTVFRCTVCGVVWFVGRIVKQKEGTVEVSDLSPLCPLFQYGGFRCTPCRNGVLKSYEEERKHREKYKQRKAKREEEGKGTTDD
jgi:hypothetical protein